MLFEGAHLKKITVLGLYFLAKLVCVFGNVELCRTKEQVRCEIIQKSRCLAGLLV